MRKLLGLVFGLGLCLALPARAEGYLFGGVDLGFSGLTSQMPGEVDKMGADVGFKGLVSMEMEKFVIDLGFGWRFNHVVGGPNIRRVTISTRNAFFEFSPRIHLNENWQLGPWAQFHFGSEVGLSEQLSTSQLNSFYLGGQLVSEWGNEKNRYRFGVRGGVDMNVPSRMHWSAGITFQIGTRIFGGGSSEPALEPAPEPPSEVSRVEEMPDIPAERSTAWDDPEEFAPRKKEYDNGAFRVESRGESTLIITTYSTALNFLTGRTTLSTGSEMTFRKLGGYLSEHSTQWERATIDGHADERGSDRYNRKLSQKRAAFIRAMFVRQGVVPGRLYSRGFGEDRPLDRRHNAAAWEQNRRVEIVVHNVRDKQALIDLVKSIPRTLAFRY